MNSIGLNNAHPVQQVIEFEASKEVRRRDLTVRRKLV
jgi:hypothetical protein